MKKKILVFHLEVKTSIRGVKEKKEASEPFDLNDVGSLSTVACWVEMLTAQRISGIFIKQVPFNVFKLSSTAVSSVGSSL